MFQLILTASDGERVDATQRVSTMSLSGSIKQVSRQLTFELVLPRDGSLRARHTGAAAGRRRTALCGRCRKARKKHRQQPCVGDGP